MTGHDDKRTRPTRAQRLVAFAFLGAFGLTILTVLLTGLWVRSPNAHRATQLDAAEPAAPERPAPALEQPVDPTRAADEPAPDGGEPDPGDDSVNPPAQGPDSTTDRAFDAPR
jgi:hypothetical protein